MFVVTVRVSCLTSVIALYLTAEVKSKGWECNWADVKAQLSHQPAGHRGMEGDQWESSQPRQHFRLLVVLTQGGCNVRSHPREIKAWK